MAKRGEQFFFSGRYLIADMGLVALVPNFVYETLIPRLGYKLLFRCLSSVAISH